MKAYVNKMHFPVRALGPGERIGIWLQGCSIGCPGCISKDTWVRGNKHETTLEAIVEAARRWHGQGATGITVSGGEPFEQPELLAALIDAMKDIDEEMDILVYSGRQLARIEREHSAILERIDALIPAPYVAALAPGGALRGSSNQPLVLRTDLARERFAKAPQGPRMQVAVHEGSAWLIGIPGPGDMERLQEAARAKGVSLQGPSWEG